MTIKDIAKLANVSPSTVSKIINGKADNIRPETREHVMHIVRKYHYSPSNYIQQASVTHSYKLGVLLNRSFYNVPFLHSLTSTARDLGYYPIVCCSDGNPDEEGRFLNFLPADGVDGIVWERANPGSPPSLPESIPSCILLNEEAAPQSSQIPYFDYGFHAAQVLISQGHSKIAFLAQEESYQNRQFYAGIRSCKTANMIAVSASDWFPFPGRSAMDLIKEGHTAAICVGEELASILAHQLAQLNYAIPRDFSTLVLSERALGSQSDFSTISIPYQAYGTFLMTRLVRMVEHNDDLPAFSSPQPQISDMCSVGAPKNYPTKHLLVIGSVHMDININSDYLPRLGRSATVNAMSMSPGGKGVNQAVGLAKLKKEVYLIGRVGSDYDGIVVQETLSKYHVRTEGLVRDSCDTGRAFIYILGNGESAITSYGGANRNLTISDIRSSRHLFQNASYCLLSTEIPMDVVEYSAAMAKKSKAKIILKPASISQISDELLAMADFFIPNESEINTLCPQLQDHKLQCQYFLSKGVGTVILTLGSKGCYLHSQAQQRYFPASAHVAVDTTGGCDAFISALAALLSEGACLDKAIHYAICAAGFCVSQLGVVPALIDREALDLYPYEPAVDG